MPVKEVDIETLRMTYLSNHEPEIRDLLLHEVSSEYIQQIRMLSADSPIFLIKLAKKDA